MHDTILVDPMCFQSSIALKKWGNLNNFFIANVTYK